MVGIFPLRGNVRTSTGRKNEELQPLGKSTEFSHLLTNRVLIRKSEIGILLGSIFVHAARVLLLHPT